jgi:hypothetical protein
MAVRVCAAAACVIVACGTYSTKNAPPGSGADAGVDAGDPTRPVAGDDPACADRKLEDNGAFVTSAGNDANACTRDAPCRTIQHAAAVGNHVYVAPGTYAESLSLATGVTIEGGWDVAGSTWSLNCTAGNAALVTVAATSNVGLHATAGATTLRLLTMNSKAAAVAGETLIGVIASTGTIVILQDVGLNIAAGGAGATGAAGPAVVDDGTRVCSTGETGDDGANGAPGAATPGTMTGAGFTPGDGADGEQGAAGKAGTAAPFPPAKFAQSCGTVGSSCALGSFQLPLTQGNPGCGGFGGHGGYHGAGGGSSVGAIADGGIVQFLRGSVTTGDGGKGGDGGAGAAGEPHIPGKQGDEIPVSEYLGGSCSAMPCSGANSLVAVPGGPPGGSGGKGGDGGSGGGGAGGWSISYVKVGNVLVSGTTFGQGAAGAGGAPNGLAGLRAQQYP